MANTAREAWRRKSIPLSPMSTSSGNYGESFTDEIWLDSFTHPGDTADYVIHYRVHTTGNYSDVSLEQKLFCKYAEHARETFITSLKELGLSVSCTEHHQEEQNDNNNVEDAEDVIKQEPGEDNDMKDHYIFIEAPLWLLVQAAELGGIKKDFRKWNQVVGPCGHVGCGDTCTCTAENITSSKNTSKWKASQDTKINTESTGHTRKANVAGEERRWTHDASLRNDQEIVIDATEHTEDRVCDEVQEDATDDFTHGERNLIVHEILETIPFMCLSKHIKDNRYPPIETGITRLAYHKYIESAYPGHQTLDDSLRGRLWRTWGSPRAFWKRQPYGDIREYFGEKIALYFAWLGYYTMVLVPATISGLIVFIYGLLTIWEDPVNVDICENLDDLVMCPQCHGRCKYWNISESCIYAKITHVFDNYATVVFTIFMVFWGIFFLEFWKRRQIELQTDWKVQEYQALEGIRPNRVRYEVVSRTGESKLMPSSEEQHIMSPGSSYSNNDDNHVEFQENHMSGLERCCKCCSSYTVLLVLLTIVFAAILGVIVYRITVVALLYGSDIEHMSSLAKIITSFTASIVNLICILILGKVYRVVALRLTEYEMHMTESDFEDAFTLKMFLFQFANTYGAITYLAFFKGRFQEEPGSTEHYLFNRYQHPPCDPSGCMINLLIQLFVVMVGKQAKGQVLEIVAPWIRVMKLNSKTKGESKDCAETKKKKVPTATLR